METIFKDGKRESALKNFEADMDETRKHLELLNTAAKIGPQFPPAQYNVLAAMKIMEVVKGLMQETMDEMIKTIGTPRTSIEEIKCISLARQLLILKINLIADLIAEEEKNETASVEKGNGSNTDSQIGAGRGAMDTAGS